ncbi:hypothetical protein KTQ42_06680|uniref:hypothetical protein n=1 Tax=Noviherbaspirillum sp. L7-7A TaxID=2850560 RepID=UPI001C2B7C5E|nr:hypothetical protein [Noviherbaspirillum sp. L7-7A]MBV0878990.1 hypothetical protein [Noviherbaspirillum sp. L7-7A]
MNVTQREVTESSTCTVFTVKVGGQVHRCALSQEALYMLSQRLDPRLDRIDAYIVLKRRVASAASACLRNEMGLPSVLQACHVADHV